MSRLVSKVYTQAAYGPIRERHVYIIIIIIIVIVVMIVVFYCCTYVEYKTETNQTGRADTFAPCWIRVSSTLTTAKQVECTT